MEANQPPSHLTIFISYGHDEYAKLTERLAEDLSADGHRVFYDKQLRVGFEWPVQLESELDKVAQDSEGGRVVYLMTPHSVCKKPPSFCLKELVYASNMKVHILPVKVVNDVTPPLLVCDIQWLDMSQCFPPDESQEEYARALQQLRDALHLKEPAFPGSPQIAVTSQASNLHKVLQPLPYQADLAPHLGNYVPRPWLEEKVDKWLEESKERIFWLSGGPGTGKSAFLAWIASTREAVKAIHFCRWGDDLKSKPNRCVMSLAYQLASQEPLYSAHLAGLQLASLVNECNTETLFDQLLVQPFAPSLPSWKGGKVGGACFEPATYTTESRVIVIDALDEASRQGNNELASLLARKQDALPSWLRFVVSSRPHVEVKQWLAGHVEPVELLPDESTQADLRRYFEVRLGKDEGVVLSELAEAAEGSFLWAGSLKLPEDATSDELAEFVHNTPRGMDIALLEYVERQFPDQAQYEDLVQPALELILAAAVPLDSVQLCKLLGWPRKNVIAFRRAVGALLIESSVGFQPFHRSFAEWLTDDQAAGRFWVDVEAGLQKLANTEWEAWHTGQAPAPVHLPAYLLALGDTRRLLSLMTDQRYLRERCAGIGDSETTGDVEQFSSLIFDLRGLAQAGLFTREVADALTAVWAELDGAGFRIRLGGALVEHFGLSDNWPEALHTAFSGCDSFSLLHFWGETLDNECKFEEALAVFDKLRDLARDDTPKEYCAGMIKGAMVLEHLDRVEEGLERIQELRENLPLASDRSASECWWALYHQGILLRRARRYDEAHKVLKEVREDCSNYWQQQSAAHHLGILYLELAEPEGRSLGLAERCFMESLEKRSEGRYNYRLAYDHHRLGQVWGLVGRFEMAQAAFDRALRVARATGHLRYIRQCERGLKQYVEGPQLLLQTTPEEIVLAELASEPGLQLSELEPLFRVMRFQGKPYVEVVDEAGASTGKAVPLQVAETQNLRFAEVQSNMRRPVSVAEDLELALLRAESARVEFPVGKGRLQPAAPIWEGNRLVYGYAIGSESHRG